MLTRHRSLVLAANALAGCLCHCEGRSGRLSITASGSDGGVTIGPRMGGRVFISLCSGSPVGRDGASNDSRPSMRPARRRLSATVGEFRTGRTGGEGESLLSEWIVSDGWVGVSWESVFLIWGKMIRRC